MARRLVIAALVLALTLPSGAAAQYGIFVGGGATFPFGRFHTGNTHIGWMARGQVFIPVQQGLRLVGGAFYGANSRDAASPEFENSPKLSGLLAGLLYRVGDHAKPGVYFFWEGGLARKTSRISGSDTRFAYSGGVGLAIPLSSLLELWLSGSYLGVLLNTDIAVGGISAGLHVRIGGNKD